MPVVEFKGSLRVLCRLNLIPARFEESAHASSGIFVILHHKNAQSSGPLDRARKISFSGFFGTRIIYLETRSKLRALIQPIALHFQGAAMRFDDRMRDGKAKTQSTEPRING